MYDILDYYTRLGFDAVAANTLDTITVPTGAALAAWEAAVQPVIDAWEATTPDGTALRAAFRGAAARP